jgi:uncharacterized protein GlcG (DUF336 family)
MKSIGRTRAPEILLDDRGLDALQVRSLYNFGPKRASMRNTFVFSSIAALFVVAGLSAPSARAQGKTGCAALPDAAKVRQALQAVVKQGHAANTGLGNEMWASVVDRDGVVCAVVFSGADRGSQWPGSRLIAAQKANTANAFSKDNFALSTGNLFAVSQTGQSLFGLSTIAPLNPAVAYAGNAKDFGTNKDPMVGKAVGGIVVFGGGFPLYNEQSKIVGGIGVSGDTSCADHVIGWKLRNALNLDAVPAGVGAGNSDNLLLDFANGASASGFGHPSCKGGKPSDEVIKGLTEKLPANAKP